MGSFRLVAGNRHLHRYYNFSGRYRELHGVTVRTDTPEHFMDDLKKYGYIKG